MEIFLNYALAWISTLCIIITSIEFFANRILKKNILFRKLHKPLGIILILTGTLHGLFSSEPILSLNFGTALLVIALLIPLGYLLRKYIKKYKWIHFHRIFTVLILVILPIHIISVGGIQIVDKLFNKEVVAPVTPSNTSTPSTIILNTSSLGTNLKLKDGVYTGTGTGYKPDLVLEITVKNNEITNINIVSHNERNEQIYGKAMNTVPSEIISAQSLDVDTVTGGGTTRTF